MDWMVLDIETAPKEINDGEIGEYLASRGKLLLNTHPLFSKLILIGIKWEDGEKYFYGENEREVLTEFCKFLDENNLFDRLKRNKYDEFNGNGEPLQFVTYNGDSFDIPYILFKSSIYKIPILDLNLSTYPYRNLRLSNHFDCLTFIAGTDNEKKVKLNIACKMLGIKIKDIGVTGWTIKSFKVLAQLTTQQASAVLLSP